jgi:hypothetical protein
MVMTIDNYEKKPNKKLSQEEKAPSKEKEPTKKVEAALRKEEEDTSQCTMLKAR